MRVNGGAFCSVPPLALAGSLLIAVAVVHGVFGACALLMPISGFWLLIPPAGLLLRASVERR